MVARIKLIQVPKLCCAAWLLVLAAISAPAVAGTLPDPTRPPPEIITTFGAGGQSDDQTGTAVENKGLQSVIIAPNRRAAIIDGQTVVQGAKYGAFTVIEVKEGAVILRDAKGKHILLTLFPGLKMRSNETPSRQQPDKVRTNTTESQPVKKTSPPVVPREAK